MKKSITITCWKRIDYFKQVLESLEKNDLSEYVIFVACETYPEMIKFCAGIDGSKIGGAPVKVMYNAKQLGVRANPYNILRYVFEDWGSDMNIYCEEDVVVSPDVANLADWFYKLPARDEFLCLCLWSGAGMPEQPNTLFAEFDFHSLGMIMTKENWFKWFRPNWLIDNWKGSVGWDWSINYLVQKTQTIPVLKPRYARSNHIGREGGVHCQPKFHDQIFANLKWNEKEVYDDFIVDLSATHTPSKFATHQK